MQTDALIHAGWVIPVEPESTILEHHSIAIDAGKIIDILETNQAREKYTAHCEHQLQKHAIIPGLINVHTHAAMSLFRGLADDLPLMQWLHEHIWPAEQRWVDEAFVRDGSRHAMAEMLRSGTTCFNDMYFFPDQTAEIAIESGIRTCIGLILIDFPTRWAKDPQEYIDKGEAIYDKYKHTPLIHAAFAPHAPYTVSDEPLQHINMLAEELDIPIHMHVHETDDEIQQGLDKYGKRPLQRLEQLGLLSQRLIAVHMTHLNEDEIELCAKYGVHIAHCPESNLKLSSGFCPVQKLLASNMNVALGTDGAASNNDLDMLGEMKTAALLAKGICHDNTSVPAETALRMGTLNGARALGLEDRIGSIEVGKEADLVAINLNSIETLPLYDPISQIVYASGREQVTDVWVAGKHLLKDRQLQTLDEAQLLKNALEWKSKISAYA